MTRADLADRIEHLRRHGSAAELTAALKQLAQLNRNSGDLEAARLAYEEAVASARRAGDPLLLAHTVRHLGDVLLELSKTPEAETALTEALELYRAHREQGRLLDTANAIRAVALLREQTGDTSAAAEYWSEARDLYAAVGVQEGVLGCSAQLARLGQL